MTTISLALDDSSTMFRRSLRRMRRYPSMTVLLVGLPIMLLLLFVYVFGGTLGAGLATGIIRGANSRAEYLEYVTPAILLMAVASAAQGTAISVAMDRSEGILARFRTMAISPSSVLAGNVLGSIVQAMMAMGVLLGVAVLLGFRPSAGPADWLALVGLLLVTALALAWLCVALGLVSKSVETASNLPNFLILLPFLSSGFVPVESMPAGLAWFAEYQPFTPIIETMRGLFNGDAELGTGLVALGWCVAITLIGFLWSRALFRRDPTR